MAAWSHAAVKMCLPGAVSKQRWKPPRQRDVWRFMRRYYFHLFNDETVIDKEGLVLPNDAVALQAGAKNARAMAADSVSKGHLVLHHRIEVQNDGGETIGTIHFRDVVQVQQ